VSRNQSASQIRRVLDEWKARGWKDIDNSAKEVAEALDAGVAPEVAAKRASRPFRANNRIQLEDLEDAVRRATAPRRPAVAVVLTALDVEYRAMRAQLVDVTPTQSRQGTRFEVGHLGGDHLDWEVAIAQIGPGNTGAAIEATQALETFQPDVLLFVGVAGALDASLIHGTVVVADRVHYYERGRAERDEWLARPISRPTSHRLTQHAATVARDSDTPAVVKTIAAGEALVGSSQAEVARIIQRHYNDAVAVDMESAGLYEAAHRGEVPALAVRGVSDHLDDKTAKADAQRQPTAARNAAAFAAALLGRADAATVKRRDR
jgi:adenosylhomocysteine nucleosidase